MTPKTTASKQVSKPASRLIVGIDEAGRGPVLGPLVMAALAINEQDLKKLEWMGVKDSKLLSSQAREELFERIREVVYDFRVEVIEPDAIDLSMKESNLNWLEADTAARMIAEIEPHTAILDCPSPNAAAYKNYLLLKLPGVKTELLVEHKADVNHPVVSAASIVAKVVRDRAIERIRQELGVDCGSGYMSDPKTQEFLAKYYHQHPHLFRKGWQPCKDLVAEKQQKKLKEF